MFLDHVGNEDMQVSKFKHSSLFFIILVVKLAAIALTVTLDNSELRLLLLEKSLLLLALDYTLLQALRRYFPADARKLTIIYWGTPVMLACYLLHYIDFTLAAIAFFLSAILLVNRRLYLGCILASAAIILEPSYILMLPLYMLYMYKYQFGVKNIATFLALACLSIFAGYFIIYREYFSIEILELLGKENRQGVLSNLSSIFGRVDIFHVIVFCFFLSFASNVKINRELFFSYLGSISIIFGLFIEGLAIGFILGLPFVIYSIMGNTKLANIPRFSYTILGSLFVLSEYPPLAQFLPPLLISVLFSLSSASLVFMVYWMMRVAMNRNEQLSTSEKPIMIGIGGDSASGKHTMVDILDGVIGEGRSIHIFGDDFHRWERGNDNWEAYTHLDPQANRLHESYDAVMRLKENKSVKLSHYDHSTGKFTEPALIKPTKFVMLVGLHPFFLEEMRAIFHIKIFVDIDDDLRKLRKIQRDVKKRGYQWHEVLEQINVRQEDKLKYIEPQKTFADLVIRYDPLEPIDISTPTEVIPKTSTSYIISNSIDIDSLVAKLKEAPDLEVNHIITIQKQKLTVSGNISLTDVVAIASSLELNLDELHIDPNRWLDGWVDGHNGVIQLIFLLTYNYTLKIT